MASHSKGKGGCQGKGKGGSRTVRFEGGGEGGKGKGASSSQAWEGAEEAKQGEAEDYPKQSALWLEGISARTAFMEARAMEGQVKGHEAMRTFMKALTEFLPYDGDWGWMMRNVRDHATMLIRVLKTWYEGIEGKTHQQKMRECHAGVRVALYEAVRRAIEGARKDGLRSAFASTTQVLRELEEDQLNKNELEELGLWTWATPEVVKALVSSVTDEDSSIQWAPGFEEVRTYPFAVELLSLRRSPEDVRNKMHKHFTYFEAATMNNEALWSIGVRDDERFYAVEVHKVRDKQQKKDATLFLRPTQAQLPVVRAYE